MAKIKKVQNCDCLLCEQEAKKEREQAENVQKHLDHPFYAESNEFREEIRKGQIVYGAGKYKEPFNPLNWTPKELLVHGAQEDVDKWHYKYGLYKHIERMEEEIEKGKAAIIENCRLRLEIEDLKASKKENNDQWAQTAMDLSRQVANLHQENVKYKAFYDNISENYGQGYSVAGYHLNGVHEPFDNFYDYAEQAMEKAAIKPLFDLKA